MEPEINIVNSGLTLNLEATRPNSPRRLLLVDAHPETAHTHFQALIKSGYEAELASDGLSAWETLQAGDFDLVITDHDLPRLSGLELVEKIRATHRAIPIILTATLLPQPELQRMPWLIPDATLQRPFTDRDLLKTVKRVLRREEKYNARMQMLLPLHL